MVEIDKGRLVTLKEAAELSGYSADYVGQLIRAGKIPGKAVYTNITWMTTAEAVRQYKQKKGGKKQPWYESYRQWGRRFIFDLDLINLFFRQFRSTLPVLLIGVVSLAMLFIASFYLFFRPASPPPVSLPAPPPVTF